jgi:phosphoribosyl 1,2-cyclic phosphodiesterase
MCAKCGCGCKPGKPAAGCKCTCPTCEKAKDKKQDAKVMKGMSPKQKSAFEKADKRMDAKKPSAKEDAKMDKALAKKVKKK